jgi:hypothetical protein
MQVDTELEEVKYNAITNLEIDNDATLKTYTFFWLPHFEKKEVRHMSSMLICMFSRYTDFFKLFDNILAFHHVFRLHLI